MFALASLVLAESGSVSLPALQVHLTPHAQADEQTQRPPAAPLVPLRARTRPHTKGEDAGYRERSSPPPARPARLGIAARGGPEIRPAAPRKEPGTSARYR